MNKVRESEEIIGGAEQGIVIADEMLADMNHTRLVDSTKSGLLLSIESHEKKKIHGGEISVLARKDEIARKRAQIMQAINSADGKLRILGPCSLDFPDTLLSERENHRLAAAEHDSDIVVVHRLPFWKPRTNPKDWHGIESVDAEKSIDVMSQIADHNNNVASETGLPRHTEDFLDFQSMTWVGSRNFGKNGNELIGKIRNRAPDMLIGIKNNLEGNLEGLIELCSTDEHLVPIFRGGTNMSDPQSWEQAVRDISGRTNGRVIVDTAHGSEMAHDPSGNFKKSVEGQLGAIRHLKELMAEGIAVRGIMSEISDIDSQTDPNIPLSQGLEALGLG